MDNPVIPATGDALMDRASDFLAGIPCDLRTGDPDDWHNRAFDLVADLVAELRRRAPRDRERHAFESGYRRGWYARDDERPDDTGAVAGHFDAYRAAQEQP